MRNHASTPIEILLVEDNPGDVCLIKELFKNAKVKNHINVAKDGEEALKMLRQENEFTKVHLPDFILLDLNLPKKNGKEVLKEMRADVRFKYIPVVVLTSSSSEEDINESYQSGANSFITKPNNLDQFTKVVNSIHEFWLSTVKCPVTV